VTAAASSILAARLFVDCQILLTPASQMRRPRAIEHFLANVRKEKKAVPVADCFIRDMQQEGTDRSIFHMQKRGQKQMTIYKQGAICKRVEKQTKELESYL
jgi:hypothetical protein